MRENRDNMKRTPFSIRYFLEHAMLSCPFSLRTHAPVCAKQQAESEGLGGEPLATLGHNLEWNPLANPLWLTAFPYVFPTDAGPAEAGSIGPPS